MQVTGTFPHPLGPGGTFTLPNDWATIAGALATDSDPFDTNPAQRWDIHDNQAKDEGHVAGFCTTDGSARRSMRWTTATAAATSGVLERVRAGRDAAGPFDPARPATLLSNGQLDSGDAPMPATRVDISIAPNSGAAGDISGAGALEPVWKTDVYSRDGNGTHHGAQPVRAVLQAVDPGHGRTGPGVLGHRRSRPGEQLHRVPLRRAVSTTGTRSRCSARRRGRRSATRTSATPRSRTSRGPRRPVT